MIFKEHSESFSSLRQLDVKVYVLDYRYKVLDEISGLIESANTSIDADSDIRRTMNLSMVLDQQSNSKYWQAGNPYWFDKYVRVEVGIKNKDYHQHEATQSYNETTLYYIGDKVKYGNKLYQCKTVEASPIDIYVEDEQLFVWDDDAQTPPTTQPLQVLTTGATHIVNIPPTNPNYWEEIQEYTWFNQGIYMVNAPTITYNATDNILSFQAIDLMSKLTGMRNGYLQGMTYQIKSGSSVTGAIKSILEEQGFVKAIINTPPINETPIDINIDIGSTTYDLLTQLRDINPDWEMFFDVNGVFRFQQIPNGQNESPELEDDVWDKIGLGYNLNTNFEDVKNYIEIVGKQIEPDEMATSTLEDDTLILTLNRPWTSYKSTNPTNVVWYIGFNIGTLDAAPYKLLEPISVITIKDSEGVAKTITIPIGSPLIYYGNEGYFVRLKFNDGGYVEGSFAGYLQPRAIAFENNPESPFYVGAATRHICSTNSLNVDFVDEEFSGYNAEYNIVGNNGTANLNITTGLNADEFSSALEGTQWAFRVNINTNDIPITNINLTYGGGSNEEYMVTNGSSHTNYDVLDIGNTHTHYQVNGSTITTLSNQPIYKDNTAFTSTNTISLDFDSSYILIMQKVGGSIKIIGRYYPISSANYNSPTTKIHSLPKFDNMVRGVFDGDEYDNIYTNDLAQQRAKYELYLNCRVHDIITINCVPLYWLDVNKLISYTIKGGDIDNRWIIKSISSDLGVNGTQSITAMKYYPLYDSMEEPRVVQFVSSEDGDLLSTENEELLTTERSFKASVFRSSASTDDDNEETPQLRTMPLGGVNTNSVGSNLGANSNEIEFEAVKISELPETTDLYNEACIPVVAYGSTKKLTYSSLKQQLERDLDIGGGIPIGGEVGDLIVKTGEDDYDVEWKSALSNAEIEELINNMA